MHYMARGFPAAARGGLGAEPPEGLWMTPSASSRGHTPLPLDPRSNPVREHYGAGTRFPSTIGFTGMHPRIPHQTSTGRTPANRPGGRDYRVIPKKTRPSYHPITF